MANPLKLLAVAGVLVLAGTASFARGDDPQPLPTHKTVRIVGSSKLSAFAPALLAGPLGEAAKDNISIEFTPMRAADAIVALATGRVDALAWQPAAAYFNAVSQGSDVKIVAQGTLYPSSSREGFYLTNAFLAGRPATPALFKGQIIASVIGYGSSITEPLFTALEKEGVPFTDISFKQMAHPDILVALENGALNAGYLVSPIWTKADPKKMTLVVGMPTHTLGAWVYGPNLITQDRALGDAYMRVITRVTRNWLQGEWWKDRKIAEALAKEIETPVETIMELPQAHFDPAMTYPAGLAERMQKVYAATPGLLTYDKPLPEDKVVDTSFTAKVN